MTAERYLAVEHHHEAEDRVKAINPVVRGFAPDPSVIRVEDWYYLATSSFEWFPTIPLHRSRDLVHWEAIGAVDSAVPRRDLLGVPDSGGIWAPALSHADGRFWVVYSIVRSVGRRYFDLETYVCTAPEAAGPWSAPIRVPGHGFDPSLLHHEGRTYLLNIQNDSRVGGRRFDGVVLTELDVERGADGAVVGLAPTGPTHLLLQHDDLVEGPKVTVKDGWFYLVLAHGGTGFEHGVLVARSRDLTGPYEFQPVPLLTSRDDRSLPLQKAGHGELVTTPSGEWFLTHLAARPLRTPDGDRCTLGRETAIQPIAWVDGWPLLAHGGHHPAVEVDVPGPPAPSPAAPTGFEVAPGWPWSTLREPPGDWFARIGPDRVRLRGRMAAASLWEQALLAQRLTEHRAEIEVTVTAEPRTFAESAGLILMYNTTSYVQLHLAWAEPDGESQAGQQFHGRGQRVLLLEHCRPGGAEVLARMPAPDGPVRLRAEIDGADGRFFAGRPGDDLLPIGATVDVSELSDDLGGLRFTGTLVGISAVDLIGSTFAADFSGWSLQVSGPTASV